MNSLSIVKELFGAIQCPVHHMKPQIIEDENGNPQTICCCPEFKEECRFLAEKIEKLVASD